jgi:hypothetical protein
MGLLPQDAPKKFARAPEISSEIVKFLPSPPADVRPPTPPSSDGTGSLKDHQERISSGGQMENLSRVLATLPPEGGLRYVSQAVGPEIKANLGSAKPAVSKVPPHVRAIREKDPSYLLEKYPQDTDDGVLEEASEQGSMTTASKYFEDIGSKSAMDKRVVVVSNLPRDMDHKKTELLVRGGGLEKLLLEKGQVSAKAVIYFIEPAAAQRYYQWMVDGPVYAESRLLTVTSERAPPELEYCELRQGLGKVSASSRSFFFEPKERFYKSQGCEQVAFFINRLKERCPDKDDWGTYTLSMKRTPAGNLFDVRFSHLKSCLRTFKMLQAMDWHVWWTREPVQGPLKELPQNRDFDFSVWDFDM